MRLNLLLVDDMPDQRDMYVIHLEQLGIRARTAADGLAAIAMIEVDRPDAMVLDLSMPRLDGLETIRHLRRDDKTRHLPIVVVSGEGHGGERAIEAGANSFLAKPCAPDRLVAEVLRILDEQRRKDQSA